MRTETNSSPSKQSRPPSFGTGTGKHTARVVSTCKRVVCGEQEAVPGVLGPMAPGQHVDSLELFMEVVCVPAAWRADPTVVPLPWRQEVVVSAMGG